MTARRSRVAGALLRLFVGFPAGGLIDATARQVAAGLREAWPPGGDHPRGDYSRRSSEGFAR